MGRIAPQALTLAPLRAVFAWRLRRFAFLGLRSRLQDIGQAFVEGYDAAVAEKEPAAISDRLARIEPELQGFAAEGIGMGLALLDCLAPGRGDRLRRFASGPGRHQTFMVHVGAGWALAFPFVSPRRLMSRLDGGFRELALDGFGFFRGYFFWRSTVRGGRLPVWIGAGRGAFDAGVGRRLWFLDDPDLEPILATIATFPESRQGDLWTGLGEACAFGGGRHGAAVALRRAAGSFLPWLAQGVAFAAMARDHAGFQPRQTEDACLAVWQRSAAVTAAIARETAVPDNDQESSPLSAWGRRLRERFIVETAGPERPPRELFKV